jgi:hypothetical protein
MIGWLVFSKSVDLDISLSDQATLGSLLQYLMSHTFLKHVNSSGKS